MNNVNGKETDPVLAAALAGGVAQVQINIEVCKLLQDALDRARRGEIHAVAMTFLRRQDMLTGDAFSVENIVQVVMLAGAMEVAKSKLVQAARETQRNVPTSNIVRANAMP
jgi:hypothetical protein